MGPKYMACVYYSLFLLLYIVLNRLVHCSAPSLLQRYTTALKHCDTAATLLHCFVFCIEWLSLVVSSPLAAVQLQLHTHMRAHFCLCVCMRARASHHILSVCFFERSPGRQLKAGISLSVSAVLKVATCERGRWLAVVSASSLNKCAAVGNLEWRWHESKL